ncbi:von Willebrand factor type A domain-containing protein [Mycena rosella]|uniref:von Willebrand factor type A domain-containing protein n=1 Tax=Mycena rosella TaxID=1033263 RepID=A0AAD7D741_MYCRO|nr:von Willebrand factor type A domain-containing protein [Mycena rosella]
MIKQDGTRVIGSVLEKQEARETYNTAIAQGQQASLMEQQTPDVFQVSVGNIPSNEQVQIELVYATELSEDEESDSIRFHLPVHIGARYGEAPQSTPFVFRNTVFISSSSRVPFLTIAASVEAIAPISKIGSPSHTVSTELGPDPKLPNFKELPFSNYARVSLSSDSALDKDFLLTIKSAGFDAPRCVAELHPAHDTVALGLTLVPRFKLPDLSRQEFVFLVDRSGSMSGKRIAAARKALVVMLRSLPHQESLFQIMSFGNRCTALWAAGSKPYNQQTLEQATRHVDAMQADYGGTEIRAALQQCFKASKGDRPMSVLVLTDGDAWDLDGVLSEVKSAVAAAPKTAYLRVSVLGIGNSASTAMCEGIARLGNGTCMMVAEEETTFTGKIARMLKAARSPPISNITVDWGRPAVNEKAAAPPDYDDFEIVENANEKKKTLNIFDQGMEDPMALDSTPAPPPPTVVLPPPAAVQQAPFVIRNLFPNIRLNAYAILQGKTVPKTVTIRGSTVDGAEIELPIPVTFSHLQNAPGAPPAFHALAARKIIQDLEDGHHALAPTLANPDDTDLLARTVKASIIRLGKTYSISSSHTSFVAVDESKPETPAVPAVYVVAVPSPPPNILYAMPMVAARVSPSGGMRGGAAKKRFRMAASAPVAPSPSGFRGRGSSSSSLSSSGFPAQQQQQQYTQSMQNGAPSNNLMPRDRDRAPSARPPRKAILRSSFGSTAPPTASSSYDSLATVESFSYEAYDLGEIDPPASVTAPLPQSMFARAKSSFGSAAGSPQQASASDPLEALARLQSFDGCFSLEVLNVIKLNTNLQNVRNALPAGATDAVVATVLAMAFLATKLGASVDRDSWEGLYEKAEQYVEAALRSMGAVETTNILQVTVATMLA